MHFATMQLMYLHSGEYTGINKSQLVLTNDFVVFTNAIHNQFVTIFNTYSYVSEANVYFFGVCVVLFKLAILYYIEHLPQWIIMKIVSMLNAHLEHSPCI